MRAARLMRTAAVAVALSAPIAFAAHHVGSAWFAPAILTAGPDQRALTSAATISASERVPITRWARCDSRAAPPIQDAPLQHGFAPV